MQILNMYILFCKVFPQNVWSFTLQLSIALNQLVEMNYSFISLYGFMKTQLEMPVSQKDVCLHLQKFTSNNVWFGQFLSLLVSSK